MRKGEQSQVVVFWRVDEVSQSQAEPDPDKLEAEANRGRRLEVDPVSIASVATFQFAGIAQPKEVGYEQGPSAVHGQQS